MKAQYTTTAISKGGRNGSVQVLNSPLQFEMALPPEMGGTGKVGVNPEQLFAAGFASCFGSALQHAVRVRKLPIPAPDVQLTIGIGRNDEGNFELAADIVAIIPGVDQALADTLAQEASAVCPYTNATRGNIQVTITARVN
jgi:lipoyl-dependent peroxiredoxin